MKLIVGLGNPGHKYADTRHNLGFMLVDRLADTSEAVNWRTESNALLAKTVLAGEACLLAKPQTYMNLSGQSVSRIVHWHRVDPVKELIVISDDIALPLGRLRMRAQGSAGGHNGIKSIIAELSSQEFPRLRLGIQSAQSNEDLADFVLNSFTKTEQPVVAEMLSQGEAAIKAWLQLGIGQAMSLVNR